VTRRQELLVAGAGALVVLAAGALLLVRPTQQATAEATADRAAAVSESQSLRDQIKALEVLEADATDLNARAKLARAEFPATPALPGLVDALQDAASLAGVDLGKVAPATPKTSPIHSELAEITTTVDITGGYFEIQDFLVRLENLVKGTDPGRVPPRSVLVRSVNLSSSSGEGTGDSAAATPSASASPGELGGNIVLLVFQLAQPAGAPSTPAATPAAPAGPGAQVR
jgi:type IV pilus assembly PilO-like protein